MNYLMEMNDYAKARHQEMIAEAVAYRAAHNAKDTGLKQLGRLLIRLGQRIKGQPSVQARPALNLK